MAKRKYGKVLVMKNTFYIVSDGYTFSKHNTKVKAQIELKLNKNDGFTDMNGLKSRWYIKKLKGKSSVYGDKE